MLNSTNGDSSLDVNVRNLVSINRAGSNANRLRILIDVYKSWQDLEMPHADRPSELMFRTIDYIFFIFIDSISNIKMMKNSIRPFCLGLKLCKSPSEICRIKIAVSSMTLSHCLEAWSMLQGSHKYICIENARRR